MNNIEMMAELVRLMEHFQLHPRFFSEIQTLLKKDLKGKEAIFFKQLTTQLNNVRQFGLNVYKTDSNELLHGADGHYVSLHLKAQQFNVRLIVYIDNTDTPFFLCAFNERAGKKNTDYSSYTSVMEERLEYFLGGR